MRIKARDAAPVGAAGDCAALVHAADAAGIKTSSANSRLVDAVLDGAVIDAADTAGVLAAAAEIAVGERQILHRAEHIIAEQSDIYVYVAAQIQAADRFAAAVKDAGIVVDRRPVAPAVRLGTAAARNIAGVDRDVGGQLAVQAAPGAVRLVDLFSEPVELSRVGDLIIVVGRVVRCAVIVQRCGLINAVR